MVKKCSSEIENFGTFFDMITLLKSVFPNVELEITSQMKQKNRNYSNLW